MQTVHELTFTYFPMIRQRSGFSKTLFTTFDTFLKLVTPMVPLLAEEAYQHVRRNFGCYLSLRSVKDCSFPITKDMSTKEAKQMWESLEKLQNMVEKEKNRFKGVVCRAEISINCNTCRDGHAISQLVKQTPDILEMLHVFFGVAVCDLKLKEEGEINFCQNLKQSSDILLSNGD